MKLYLKMNHVLLAIVILGSVLGFQNCSSGFQSSSASGSSPDQTDSESASADFSMASIEYPRISSAIHLVSGQSITLKIAKPSAASDLTNYIWLAYGASGYLNAHYGLPVEYDGSIYITLNVRASVVGQVDFKVYLYDYTTGSYLDSEGVWISLNTSGASRYTADALSEVCTLRSSYAPTFNFNPAAASAVQAFTVFDNGAGVENLSCSFKASDGTITSVDCKDASNWPSYWSDSGYSFSASGSNRCGQYQYSTF